VVDEIHAPLVDPGNEFVPVLSLPDAQNAVVAFSAGKGWNLPAFKAGLYVRGTDAVAAFDALPPLANQSTGQMATIAHTAALRHGQAWVDAVMVEVAANKDLLGRLNHVVSSDFGRVTYTEAVEILQKHRDEFEYPVYWGCDLQTEHERYLTEKIFMRPIFVTNYPKEIKAFYMRLDDDGRTVAAADCLVPGIGEIIGGSQREERIDVLVRRMNELELDPEDYWWYLDLRRYGSCRHAGYGLGFERLVMYLTGVSNIRDVLPHPRTVGSAEF